MSMGVKFGADILKEQEAKLKDYFPVAAFISTEELSPSLNLLCSSLDEASPNSRILIFVQTRACASRSRELFMGGV